MCKTSEKTVRELNKIPESQVVMYNYAAMSKAKSYWSFFLPWNPGGLDVNEK